MRRLNGRETRGKLLNMLVNCGVMQRTEAEYQKERAWCHNDYKSRYELQQAYNERRKVLTGKRENQR